jgi:Arc/MetJ-type ribon-helix-helix transcriptional regulator
MRFINTKARLIFLAKRVKNRLMLEQYRNNFLVEAWVFVLDNMCDHFEKDKKHRKKVDKLKMLPDSYRKEFLDLYYRKCKLRYMHRVLLGISDGKGNPYASRSEVIKEEIKLIDKKLGFKKEAGSTAKGASSNTAAQGGSKNRGWAMNKDLNAASNKKEAENQGGAKGGGEKDN